MAFDWDRTLFSKVMMPRQQSLLDIKQLEEQIERTILSSGASAGHKKKKSFSPSSFGGQGTCPRYWHFAFGGAEFEFSPDALGLFAMKFGTRFGDDLEKDLVKSAVASASQVKVEASDPPIFGLTDFIGEIDGEEYVADIKTVGNDVFNKIKESGKGKDAHVVQVLLYMKILKLKSGLLLYVNRDTGKMMFIPISISDKHIQFVEYMYRWMRDVKRWADEEEVPPARGFTKSTWQCKSCPVRETCDSFENIKKTGPGKLEIDIDKAPLND